MSIINLEDYRPSKKGEPCKVTFFSPTFAADGRIEWTVMIEDGDYVGAIEAVKNYGGAYLPSQDGGKDFLVFALALRRRPSLGGGAINLDRARAVDACEWMTIDDMTNASVAHFISLPAPNATAADRRAAAGSHRGRLAGRRAQPRGRQSQRR